MFQLKQPKTTNLISSKAALLEETHLSRPFSFHIQLVQKKGLGFSAVPNALYITQLDHEKIVLENTLNPDLAFSIFYKEIQSIRLNRSLNFTPVVHLCLKQSIVGLQDQTSSQPLLLIASSPLPHSAKNNRSGEFVELIHLVSKTQDSPFIHQLSQAQRPVITYFWAKGCQPCEEFSITVNRLQAQWGDQAEFVSINMDDEMMLPMLYEVSCIPALLVFKDQKVVDRIDGAIPEAIAQKIITRHL